MKPSFISRIWQQRELILRLAQRDVLLRYRGSLVGWGWTLLNPLMMLAIYTFVFSTIFKARWELNKDLGPAGFALNIFAGMVVFALFSECANKAPALITSNSNYVTKVRFPLEALGCATVLSALFHAATSALILLVFRVIVTGSFPWSALLLPVVWLPYVMGTLAATWLLSGLGVYLRDLNQFVVVATSALMFMSAVFYPLAALPQRWAPIFRLNPIASWVEQTRSVIVLDHLPSVGALAIELTIACVVCEWSLRLFNKAGRGFADVL